MESAGPPQAGPERVPLIEETERGLDTETRGSGGSAGQYTFRVGALILSLVKTTEGPLFLFPRRTGGTLGHDPGSSLS